MNQAALLRLLGSGSLAIPGTTDIALLFEQRLAANLGLLQHLFFSLYPEDTEAAEFQKLIALLPELFHKRPDELKAQDRQRLAGGNWYQSEQLAGMQLYVDNFSRDLKGLSEKLPYFEKLGINFLHLMPLTTRPSGENDGGYAVNSYTEIDPKFGTKEDLLSLTRAMRSRKMYLMLDFVVNHTSDEYPWAKKAALGDPKYQGYYYTYPDREIPDTFEKSMPEIFPQTSPGNFSWHAGMGRWVMTVFNSYQWDLNYTNPEVFREMLTNLVEKVNMGVDVIRFDALAFLWKKQGTNCQNLPEAHRLISLFRLCLQVVAPGVALLAEAIVAPRDITRYFGEGITEGNECEIAYNASLMALLWNSIATKETGLLTRSLNSIPGKPAACTWINYIRCHDDIGLGYDDDLIRGMGWDPQHHRRFLLDYYCRRLEWSPATGLVFMYNPRTGDGRITGSAASLLGLEKALSQHKSGLIRQAVDKIVMMHGIILTIGGIPLIYAGDEIATLNDYSFLDDPLKKDDSRWVNRPRHDWDTVAALEQDKSPASEVFERLREMIAIRKKHPLLADHNNLLLHDANNPHILAYERKAGEHGILVLCNFDETAQVVDAGWLSRLGYSGGNSFRDLISGKDLVLSSGLLQLNPFQMLWLARG